MASLEFQNVSFSLANKNNKQILSDVTFSVPPGESLTILGPSGSGKSTLLRLCNRLIDPTHGRILYDDRDLREHDIARLRRKIGLVPQNSVFIHDLNLRDNILYGVRFDHDPGYQNRDYLLRELLRKVGLQVDMLERRPDELSGGEAQRVCLARTLATRPEILLLDEPTSSLDPSAKRDIERLIQSLQETSRLSTLFVTHDVEQARRLGGRGIILIDGRIADTGQIDQLLDRSDDSLSRQFLQTSRGESIP